MLLLQHGAWNNAKGFLDKGDCIVNAQVMYRAMKTCRKRVAPARTQVLVASGHDKSCGVTRPCMSLQQAQ